MHIQAKERKLIEAVTTTQTMNYLGNTAAAVGSTAVGYLVWKTAHDVLTV